MASWSVWPDVRVAARSLLKSPALAFVVVLTLAVAIGANTAIFSVVESVLLKPLPYPDETRIVRVAATVHERGTTRGDRGNAFSDRGYWHFANNNRSFEKFGASAGPVEVGLTGEGAARQVVAALMTLSAFEVLGVRPELGRFPTPEEDASGGAAIALLSHDLWVSQYAADPTIVGRVIYIDGGPREVIGVMPAHYDFPAADIDVWVPLRLNPASGNFSAHYLSAVARLAAGSTIETAIADARSLVGRFGEVGYGAAYFEGIFDGGAVVRPLRDVIAGEAREPLLIVLGTVAFVLLIACSNVANLLLVRADTRRREIAVRMALGGTRARLVQYVLIESALLALAGGVAGVLLAYAGTGALVAVGPPGIPRLGEIEVSGAALAFTAAVSTLAAVLCGVLPALGASSANTTDAFRDGGRSATPGLGRQRARNGLVTTQVALAFVLVIGCGLMVRSFDALRSVDPGFAVDNVLTFAVRPPLVRYTGAEAVAQFYERLIERLTAVPGVERVGAIDALPLTGRGRALGTVLEEFPPAEGQFPPVFQIRRATPGFFEAMSIPVVEGRALTPDDHQRRLGSVVISRSIKDTYWPRTSALGKRLTVSGTTVQVVGVVGDVRSTSLDAPVDRLLYLPMLDAEGGSGVEGMTLTLRTSIDPLRLVAAIRGAIAELDPDVPLADVRPTQRIVGDSMSRTSFTAAVLSIAAFVALFLGSVGIYAVLSYAVSQRTAEIGIRSALGATPGNMRRMIVSQGMWLVTSGVLIGLIATVALSGLLTSQLYGVTPVDPLTTAATTAIFLAVALLASLLPAARAAGTSPLDALRVG
jgi:putative ABC transport system permease protein